MNAIVIINRWCIKTNMAKSAHSPHKVRMQHLKNYSYFEFYRIDPEKYSNN